MPTTTTRYELRAKDGTPVAAQWDLIPGKAYLNEEQNLTPDGKDLEWEGGTKMYWDAQVPEVRYGEAVYCDHAGNEYLAGDLVVAEITRDEEGEEKVTTRPYSQGIQYSFAPQRTPGGKSIRALDLAQWIIGSDQDVNQGALAPESRDRIHSRARAYAQAEEVADLVDAILGTLKAACAS